MFKNRFFQIFSISFFILLLLNPSMQKFKEYTGSRGTSSDVFKRKFNGLIFSIYERQTFWVDEYDRTGPNMPEKYLGVLMNFVFLNSKEIEAEKKREAEQKSNTKIQNVVDTTK